MHHRWENCGVCVNLIQTPRVRSQPMASGYPRISLTEISCFDFTLSPSQYCFAPTGDPWEYRCGRPNLCRYQRKIVARAAVRVSGRRKKSSPSGARLLATSRLGGCGSLGRSIGTPWGDEDLVFLAICDSQLRQR